ncbi:hypothetical protein CBR_g26230 [Chara braunii]|uniref:Tr-type G domain-containing protein n=1 Tax=Chara braunii TaxID=69332 RepID=A0A388L7D1_CHABU|nr:hypothetical protein CBR_g26230 [Chara braunii]|eukprot:GBG78197.1 hypothetical protein CBR_g26230 [Chara braunii]
MLGGTVQMESCCRLNAHSAVAPQRLSRTGCTPNKVTSCYALQDRVTSSRIQSEQPQQRCCQRLEAGGLQRWCDLKHGHRRSRLHSRGLSDGLFRKGCERRRGDRSKVVGVGTPSPKAIATVDKAAETVTDSQDKQTSGTSTTRDDIRNIAIIAHVDHGKTTLVDAMLRQAKVFRENQVVQERIMDSNALERERGITILSKNTAIRFKNVKINIIDTPGHSDFGGEVERVLNMVDGVLLLVDSVEGPMPQTRFVLKKAVELGHKVVVVVNKIDRPSARPGFVVDSTFELFCELNASDEQCDFPVVYASGVQGVAGLDPGQLAPDLEPLFDTIISRISPPIVLKDAPLQMLIGETLACKVHGVALPTIKVEEPTVRMSFMVNISPFAGKEGKYVTSRNLRERLYKELEKNLAMKVEDGETSDTFIVSGRGTLHIAILIENMRREGYEFMVGAPRVINKEVNGRKLEPLEEAIVEVPEEYVGTVVDLLGKRRGQMMDMSSSGLEGTTIVKYLMPTRGLLGLRNTMLTATRGTAVLNTIFHGYGEWAGDISMREQGSLVAFENGQTTAYALFSCQERGQMFITPGVEVYKGQIIGVHQRPGDLALNACKKKAATNIRSNKEQTVILNTPLDYSLDDCIEYIQEDELVEVTPLSVRMCKNPKMPQSKTKR